MSEQQRTSSWLGSALLAAGLFGLLVGERVFGSGSMRAAVSGAGVLACLVAFGLRARALSVAQGDVRAVEARLLSGYVGVLGALGLYGLTIDPALHALHWEDDSRTHAATVVAVLWPALLCVASSAIFFMELSYARMPIAASVELRRIRTAAHAGLTLGFSVVFLASMSYVAIARDVRRDVTYFKTTQPSAGTQRMLSKLGAPVKAVLFFRKTDDVLPQVEPYFAALRRKNPKVYYEVQDFALAPELARKHKVSGNGSVLLLQGEGDKQKSQSLRIGTELTEARPHLKKLDGEFQTAVGKLVRPERVAWLTVGHGERTAKREHVGKGEGTLTMGDVFRRLNLRADPLGIAQGLGNAVPDGASVVIVTGPSEKLLPDEAQTLLDYVRKGGRVMLMVDPGVDDGLDPLLQGLGLARLPGVLVSEKNHMEHSHDDSDKLIVYSNSYSSHPSVTTVSRYQSEVASIFVRGAALVPASTPPSPKPAVTFPVHSAPDFFRDLDGNLKRDESEPEESLNMVAAVTLSEKPDAAEGRAIVIGDGDFMTDKLASNNGNVLLFVDALAWLIGNEELPSEVSSEEDVPLEHSRDKDKIWFYATTFGVPLPVAGLGLWVARRRRRRAEASA